MPKAPKVTKGYDEEKEYAKMVKRLEKKAKAQALTRKILDKPISPMFMSQFIPEPKEMEPVKFKGKVAGAKRKA